MLAESRKQSRYRRAHWQTEHIITASLGEDACGRRCGALQEFLETELTEVLGTEKRERTAGRQGYRSGSFSRTLITRVGKLELRVPQDRASGSRPSC